MLLHFQRGEEILTLDIERDGDAWRVLLPDGVQYRIGIRRRPDDVMQITTEKDAAIRVCDIPFARLGQSVAFSREGMAYAFEPREERASGSRKEARSGVLAAPMAGVVTQILVSEGQRVEAYQPLITLEAMKVVTTLDAPFAGTVQAIHAQPQQQVAHGAAVIEIAPEVASD